MEDREIVELFFQRDETAIREIEKKYSRYLTKIAQNILHNEEDCVESVNDTYLKAWNSIPPHKPEVLSTFLGKITRETSIDLLRKKNSVKRGGGQYDAVLSEMEDCIGTDSEPWQDVEVRFLVDVINKFLETLPEESRNIFVCRYYFMDSIKEIAAYGNYSQSKVKSILYRIRISLKDYLESEGFII